MADASSGAMSDRPRTTSPVGNGSRSASSPSDADTALGSRIPDQPAATATHATTVERITAISPTGASNGIRRPPSHPTRMKPRAMNAIHGACHIWAAGLIEMKVIEMPASAPSSAARGVQRRIHGPKTAPSRTMHPMMKAQARPARQASSASPVARNTGSMTTKTTMKVCGTLGP